MVSLCGSLLPRVVAEHTLPRKPQRIPRTSLYPKTQHPVATTTQNPFIVLRPRCFNSGSRNLFTRGHTFLDMGGDSTVIRTTRSDCCGREQQLCGASCTSLLSGYGNLYLAFGFRALMVSRQAAQGLFLVVVCLVLSFLTLFVLVKWEGDGCGLSL